MSFFIISCLGKNAWKICLVFFQLNLNILKTDKKYRNQSPFSDNFSSRFSSLFLAENPYLYYGTSLTLLFREILPPQFPLLNSISAFNYSTDMLQLFQKRLILDNVNL